MVVTLSSEYQLTIPESIRDSLDLRPGQKIQAMISGDRIELIPLRPMSELRGFLPGLDTTLEPETDRL